MTNRNFLFLFIDVGCKSITGKRHEQLNDFDLILWPRKNDQTTCTLFTHKVLSTI